MGMFDDLIPQQTAPRVPPKGMFDDLIPAGPKPSKEFPYSADNPPPRKNHNIGPAPSTPGLPGVKIITGTGAGMADPKREAEMQAMDAAKPKGMFDDLIPKKPATAPAGESSEFTKAFIRSAGPQNMMLTAQTMLAYEDLTGDTTFSQSANELLADGEKWSKGIEPAKVPTLKDINLFGEDDLGSKLRRVGDWTQQAAGSGLGSTLVPMAGGFAGGFAGGRVAGKPGAAVGSILGAFTGSNALNIGSMRQTLIEEGVTDPKLRGKVALAGGMAMSGLDSLLPGEIAGKFTGAARKELERSIIRRMIKGAASGSVKEGLTEGAQQAIQEVFGKTAAGKNIDAWQLIDGVIENAAQGAVGGAVMGGTADALAGPGTPPAPVVTPPPVAPQTVNAAGKGDRIEPRLLPPVNLPPTPPGYTGPTENTGIAPEDVQSMTPGQRAVIEKDLAEQGAAPIPEPVLPTNGAQPIVDDTRETKPEPGKAPMAPRNFAPPKENMFADLIPAKPPEPAPSDATPRQVAPEAVAQEPAKQEIAAPQDDGPIQPISKPQAIETIEQKPISTSAATVSEKPADLSTGQPQPVEQIAESPQAQQKPAPAPRTPIARRDMEDDTAVTSSGRDVPVKYAVVEAKDLVASQLDDGGSNPQYPAELQPRDRERAVSQQQVQDIATKLDPRLLDKSPKASDGSPIIAEDGTVESGNGRVLAIRRAYQQNGESAKRYREHLAAQGYPVDGVSQPVLVRVRQGEMAAQDRQAFTREANERDTLGMSATERAMADAQALPDKVTELYRGGEVNAAGNREFVRAFIRDVVAKNDQANIIAADGAVNQEAIRRIEAALLAKAYGDADLVAKLTESPDSNIKAIGGALMDVAPAWAQMRSEAKAGTIDKDADQTERLLEAVRLVERARLEGQPLALLVGQTDIFSGSSLHPIAEAFLRLMFRDMKNWKQPIGRERLAGALQFYVDEERKTSSGTDLLGETAAKPGDILSLAKRKQDNGEAAASADQPKLDLATRPSPRTGESAGASGEPRAAQDIPAGQASRSEKADGDGKPEPKVEPPKAEEPAPQPTSPPEPLRSTKPTARLPENKITDFGERIEGARKDAVKDIVQSLTDDIDIASEPLSKTFPQPDYEKLAAAGVDAKALALVAVMRDVIPMKPKKAYKLKSWAESVKQLRNFSSDLLEGTLTAESISKKMRESRLSKLANTAEIISDIAPEHLPFAAKFRVASHSYINLNGKHYPGGQIRYLLEDEKGRQTRIDEPTLDALKGRATEAIQAAIDKQIEKGPVEKRTPIKFYRDRKSNELFIGFKGMRDVIRLKSGFTDLKEAAAYVEEHADELQAKIDELRKGPEERRAANAPRVGPARRDGDVSPQQFNEVFGFRGVQFGNWVEGDRRQSDLNEAFDALMDMADILSIPPRALSLDGQLGLAFGARGHGKAMAHYESMQVVINLTKTKGAGSLAHEWLHALDNYFAKQDTGTAAPVHAFISERKKADGKTREAVFGAWKAVEKSISTGSFAKRSDEFDAARAKPYFGTTIEKAARSFERYVHDRMAEQGANNDYLANINLNGGAYPTEAEMAEQGIRQAYDDLFKTVETVKNESGSVGLREGADDTDFPFVNKEEFRRGDNPLGLAAREYVVGSGKSDGNEYLIAFDASGRIAVEGHGTGESVGFSQTFYDLIRDANESILLHHNHPRSASLSYDDISMLGYHGTAAVWAHGHDGTSSRAALTESFAKARLGLPSDRAREQLDQIGRQAYAGAYNLIQRLHRERVLTTDEANAAVAHVANLILERSGLIDYTTNRNYDKIADNAQVETAIASVATNVRSLAGRLFNDWQVHDTYNVRRAAPVRGHVADIEDLGSPSEGRDELARRSGQQEGRDRRGPEGDRPAEKGPPKGLRQPRMPDSRPAPSSFIEPDDSAMSVLMNQNLPMLGRVGGAISNASLPIRRGVQDKMADWKRMERAVTEQTGELPQAMRVYRTETLFHGRTGERLEDLRLDTIEPLIEQMSRLKVTQADLDKYLYARHAPERNAYIATINPDLPDGGSGMTNAEAQAVMRDMQRRGVLANVRTIAVKIDIMLKDNRERLFNNGIIDQETYDSWTNDYEHYVPLRGFEANPEEDARLGQGKRYDSRTKVVLEALGRKSKADSPLAYIIAQAQQSIILAEKARVGRSALRLARQFPNNNIWEVDQVVTKRVRDPSTGLVSTRIDGTAKVRAENVLAVREGGKLYWLTLHHDGLLAGIKGTEASSMNAVLRMGVTINRYLALMRTGLDPQFFIPNFLRDLETAGVHIAADQGKSILKNVLRDLPKALAGSFKGERGNLSSAWAQHYREFAQAGGKVGVFGLEDINTIKQRIARDLAWAEGGTAVSALKAAKAVKDFVADINGAIESGVRLALFVNMRRAGYSVDDSAFAAKEVTVNFNRKGEWGTWLNATYMFFNTSVQGTARIAQALARSKLVRRAAFGMFLTGILMDIVNSMMSGDSDDDGEDDYDQIQEHVLERNFVVMWPGSESGQEIHIPLPWVYNTFFYAGNNVGRLIRGKIKATEGAANIMGAVAQAANPLYSNSWVQMVTPTILDPGLDLYMNEDWKGDPIMPGDNPFGVKTPDSQKAWETVNPAWRETAEFLNKATGGDEVRPGTIDVSPESIEYIWDFLLGGVGSTISQTSSTVGTLVRGDEINPERIPFVRKVYGKHVSAAGREEFYQMRDAILLTDEQISTAKDQKDRAKMIEIRKQYPADVRILPLLKETDKLLTRLRKQKNAATSDEAKQKINERMDLIRSRFRKKYRLLQENLQ